ncbi:hypothetical protein HMPREF9248_0888 [Fannyhessea vaginae PB189-T1-4]|uniref:Uncharacterized protein n=1 Tax=Fannyhessea vaginae PB189-T1-4 TaxID=866774 RepID=A0ABP2J4V0_9ACTN|nr:hypothetical protein HMPREF9248_0888 [Fannyhessea vaginae PB189-T1-4]
MNFVYEIELCEILNFSDIEQKPGGSITSWLAFLHIFD